MKIFVGVDIGKKNHDSCFLKEDGAVISSLSFANTRNGFDKFLHLIKELQKQNFDITVIVEATGHYFLNLYSFLRNNSIDVIVVNPIQIDSFRNVFIRKSKSDRRDSFMIAELARIGRAKSSIINDSKETISNLRMLTRFRAEYISKKTNLIKKLSSLVERLFPEFFYVFKNLNIKTSLLILKSYPSPRRLLEEDKEILFSLVKKWSKGRIKREKINMLLDLAKQSIGSPIDIDAIEIEIPFIIDEIFFIEKQVEKIREEIERKAKGIREIELLKTIPGIGTVSAASIVGEITSISRFSSVSKLRAYAGIDPSIRESGTSVRGKSTLSKRGSPYLRRTLFYAANATRRFSPVFKDYYERKILQHPDKERYAIIATANKLLSVIFYILKHNVPFDPNYERRIKNLSH